MRDLQECLSLHSTYDICYNFGTLLWLNRDKMPAKYGLLSPYKEITYLLSVALTTPEPTDPVKITEAKFNKFLTSVKLITSWYTDRFFAGTELELEGKTDKDLVYRKVMVAVGAFSAFRSQTRNLASVEQLTKYIQSAFTRFDKELVDLLGISATQALLVTQWLVEQLQEYLNNLVELYVAARQGQAKYTALVKRKRWSDERSRREGANHPFVIPSLKFMEAAGKSHQIVQSKATHEFGHELATAYFKIFVSQRSTQLNDPPFYEGVNTVERQHLIRLDSNALFCMGGNPFYDAYIEQFSDALTTSQYSEAFHTHKGKILESRTLEAFSLFLPPEAKIYTSVYETCDAHKEHDIIISFHSTVLVIEAKSTRPSEAFRDVEPSYKRYSQQFKKDTGIQKAYNQANNIRKRLLDGENVSLYDARGSLVTVLQSNEVDKVFLICVTADNYGILASDLSLLLQKEDTEDYPWSVNVYDLENILGGFERFGRSSEDFITFIEQRIKFHGNSMAGDELNYAGAYLRDKSLLHALSQVEKGVRVMFADDYSKIFDDIWSEKNGSGSVDTTTRDNPDMIDLKKLLKSYR